MRNLENDRSNSIFNRKTSLVLALGAGALIVGAPFVAPALAGPLNSDSLVDPEWESAVRKHVEKRFFHLIDATEAQQAQLDDLFKKMCDSNRSTREQVKQGAVDVANLMADQSATEEQIRSKVADIRKLREKLQDSRLETALKVRAILTVEQRKVVSDRVIGFITGNQRRLLLRSMM
ncbi:MAG: periplasmic heavy metal sensor [Candidatus Obscuribacterales bacterium]|nr:periplasmic heavy metal sensor [Candidatus Obscuribacterales bacterium]